MAKKHKYILTIEFESEIPVKKYADNSGIQFENGLGYFVDTHRRRSNYMSVNETFVYGSGKTTLKKVSK